MSGHRAPARVRFGVIGCGTIAYWAHLRTLQRLNGASLVAAADPDPDARARAAHLVHGPVFSTAEDLLRTEVDAVLISVPNALHAELAIAAAFAGKHVYVEKPVATTAEEARAVSEAVARSGVVAAVGFNYRCHPAHRQARVLLTEGRIGAVRAVHTAFCEPLTLAAIPEWKRQRRSGGGAVFDLASHHVDLLRWLLDDEIEVVNARIASTRTEDDSATLALTMRSGVEVQMYVSFRAGPADFLEFIGERGMLRIDRYGVAPTLKLTRRLGYGVRSAHRRPTIDAAALRLRRFVQPSYEPSFRAALADFVQRIHGRPVQVATIEDGARSLAAVLAAMESAQRQAPIVLP